MSNTSKDARELLVGANLDEYEAIEKLCRFTDREKSIIELKYTKGLTLTDIGYELGLSESTIKKAHVKLIRKIAKAL